MRIYSVNLRLNFLTIIFKVKFFSREQKNIKNLQMLKYIFSKIKLQFLHLYPDPDPTTHINADPWGSRSATLLQISIFLLFATVILTLKDLNVDPDCNGYNPLYSIRPQIATLPDFLILIFRALKPELYELVGFGTIFPHQKPDLTMWHKNVKTVVKFVVDYIRTSYESIRGLVAAPILIL